MYRHHENDTVRSKDQTVVQKVSITYHIVIDFSVNAFSDNEHSHKISVQNIEKLWKLLILMVFQWKFCGRSRIFKYFFPAIGFTVRLFGKSKLQHWGKDRQPSVTNMCMMSASCDSRTENDQQLVSFIYLFILIVEVVIIEYFYHHLLLIALQYAHWTLITYVNCARK